jgi:hypothetical protein
MIISRTQVGRTSALRPAIDEYDSSWLDLLGSPQLLSSTFDDGVGVAMVVLIRRGAPNYRVL